jgi:hypothetical protein
MLIPRKAGAHDKKIDCRWFLRRIDLGQIDGQSQESFCRGLAGSGPGFDQLIAPDLPRRVVPGIEFPYRNHREPAHQRIAGFDSLTSLHYQILNLIQIGERDWPIPFASGRHHPREHELSNGGLHRLCLSTDQVDVGSLNLLAASRAITTIVPCDRFAQMGIEAVDGLGQFLCDLAEILDRLVSLSQGDWGMLPWIAGRPAGLLG